MVFMISKIKPKTNTIFRGDNLSIMRALPSEFVDLCYIDPPFYTQKNYENIWGDRQGIVNLRKREIHAFEDTKDYFEKHIKSDAKGLDAYLEWLRYRVTEIHRLLKPTGTFFLHLDYHAVHYAKVMLDEIFGYNNFQNEIVWRRKTGSNATTNPRRLPCNTDTILFYTKSSKYTFNPQFRPSDPEYVKKFFRFDDNDGRGPYSRDNISSPSDRPNLKYEYKGYSPPEKGWRYDKATMKKLDAEGKIYFPENKAGRVRVKRYLKDMKGSPQENIWDDIGMLQHAAGEKTGYATQKPLPLLERIIKMCSNEGDLVFDCFAGCGTSMEAAHNLKRKWIGIDISRTAVRVNEERLVKAKAKVTVIDEDDLVDDLKFERQTRNKKPPTKGQELWT
jgi:site-specific DNA-methyltransferase (adenine-specific)